MLSIKPSGSLEYYPKSGRAFKSPSKIQIEPLPNGNMGGPSLPRRSWGQPPSAVHRAQPECFLIESGKLSTQRNVRHGGPIAPFDLQNSPNAAVKPDTDPISML
jgi:hypothetical protein